MDKLMEILQLSANEWYEICKPVNCWYLHATWVMERLSLSTGVNDPRGTEDASQILLKITFGGIWPLSLSSMHSSVPWSKFKRAT